MRASVRVAQSTVGRHVERVEDHFGGGLFESRDPVRLSMRGSLVLASLRSVIAELGRSRDRLALDRPVLRIGFIRVVRPLLGRVLRRLANTREIEQFDVRLLELPSEQLAQKLSNLEPDIAISYVLDGLFPDGTGIEQAFVTSQPYALVVPESAWVRDALDKSALTGMHYAHLPRSFSREGFDGGRRWLREQGLQPARAIECKLATELIAYAGAGRGYGFLPALWGVTNHDGVVFAPAPEFAPTVTIAIYWLRHVASWAPQLRDGLSTAARTALRNYREATKAR